MSDKKKHMLTIVSILVLTIGVTFAYLAARISDGTLGKLKVTADNVDDLKFSVDKDLVLTLNQYNLTNGGDNLTDETNAVVSLKANSTNNTVSYNYYVYLNISKNNFIYTTEEQKPEIILSVTGPNGEITSIEGLTYLDGTTTNGVKGFDITTEIRTFAIVDKKEITSESSTNYTNHEYKIKVTFINLDTNQKDNQGKELNATVTITKDELKYALGDLNQDGSVDAGDYTVLNNYLMGETKLSKLQKDVADVNEDGVIDANDAYIIFGANAFSYTLPYQTPTMHKITYNLDGGTPKGVLTTQYAEGLKMPITLYTDLKLKGDQVFIGWTKNDTDTPVLNYSIPTTSTEDITLKANWWKLGDVNKDGTIDSGDSLRILKLNGKKSNYNFETKLGDVNQDGYVDNFDFSLVMKYSVGNIKTFPYDNSNAYKITYDLNGGTEDIRNQRYYLTDAQLYEPTREGYTFIGWTGSNGTIPETYVNFTKNGTKPIYKSDLHFKANWQKNS